MDKIKIKIYFEKSGKEVQEFFKNLKNKEMTFDFRKEKFEKFDYFVVEEIIPYKGFFKIELKRKK